MFVHGNMRVTVSQPADTWQRAFYFCWTVVTGMKQNPRENHLRFVIPWNHPKIFAAQDASVERCISSSETPSAMEKISIRCIHINSKYIHTYIDTYIYIYISYLSIYIYIYNVYIYIYPKQRAPVMTLMTKDNFDWHDELHEHTLPIHHIIYSNYMMIRWCYSVQLMTLEPRDHRDSDPPGPAVLHGRTLGPPGRVGTPTRT